MLRLAPLLIAAAAAATAPPGCGALRGARVGVTRLETARPEHALLRCLVDGGRAPIAYAWRLSPGVHQAGFGVPSDEATLLVTVEPQKASGAGLVTCTASDATGKTVSASAALAPLAITKAPISANGLVTVEGSGFGSSAADGAVWLVPVRGAAVPADLACKQAAWADSQIVACLPRLTGAYEVRVESAGRLAIAPGSPLVASAALPLASPTRPPPTPTPLPKTPTAAPPPKAPTPATATPSPRGIPAMRAVGPPASAPGSTRAPGPALLPPGARGPRVGGPR